MSFAEPAFERHRFTADEVMEMAEVGAFARRNVELLEGDLITVSPQGPIHSTSTVLLHRALEDAYGRAHHVRDHSPVRGTVDSIPEPDLAVVRGDPRNFFARLPGPTDVSLVIEIAFTTLAVDRHKARIYARAGYAAYWLVDVQGRRVEVYTKPTDDGVFAKTEIVPAETHLPLPGLQTTLCVHTYLPEQPLPPE